MQFQHTRLDNGLTVIGERNPNAQSMACGYFVKTGSRDETPDISGVSHFLEHMMFKGSDRRTAEDVNREFDELGARHNAFTSEESTVYFGRVLPEFQPRLIDLLTDMMRPTLREDDFNVEKNVILEEIAMYEDRPPFVAYEMARALFANGHPVGNSVLGTADSIKALERDKMAAYFERRYSPGNLVFAMTGAFDWNGALEQAVDGTAAWRAFDVDRDTSPPEFAQTVKVVQNGKFTREHLVWMCPGLSVQDERRYAAGILAAAVGDDVGSRLYWALVDPGIADDASLSHDAEDHAGMFSAYASCDPERAGEVVGIVHEILDEAMRNGITDEEIERAKQKFASALVLRSETPMGRLVPVGMSWVYRDEYVEVDETVNRLLSVSRDDVNALLAERPFDARTLLALGPLDSLDSLDSQRAERSVGDLSVNDV